MIFPLSLIWRGSLRTDDESNESGFDHPREFAYLDDIGVQNLLASIGEGGTPTQQTNFDRKANTKEIGGGSSIPTGGGNISLNISESQESERSVEEVREFNAIQAKFTNLRANSRITKPISIDDPTTGSNSKDPVPVENIKRGDIIEFRADLNAHSLFRLYHVLNYISEVNPGELSEEDKRNLKSIRKGLGDAIPIIATVSSHHIISKNEKELIVRKEPDEEIEKPIQIVSKLKIDNMWGDPLNTLFDEKDYIIYCHIESPGIDDEWYPLKITQAINSISGSLADKFGRGLEDMLSEAETKLQNESRNLDISDNNTYLERIHEYSTYLEHYFGIELPERDQKEYARSVIDSVSGSSHSDRRKEREILKKYTSEIASEKEIIIPTGTIQNRLRENSKGWGSQSTTVDDVSLERLDKNVENAYQIEGKVIGIYW